MAYNDFPCVNFLVPAFSERAVDCLKEFLEPNGELLPLEHPAGKFFAFNCLRVVDILDQDKSNVEWFSSTGPHKFALDIRHFVVDEDRLKSLSVFRLREQLYQHLHYRSIPDRHSVAWIEWIRLS